MIGCQQWRHAGRSSYLCQKKMNSDQDIKEKFGLKPQPENRTTSLSIIFSSEVLKDANQ
jgi:hypothetical protein